MSEEATGPDGVTKAVPALIVPSISSNEGILIAHVVESLIDNPGPTLHPDGVTAADGRAEVRTVTAAFIEITLKVLVLIEEYLHKAALCVRSLYLL